MKSTAVRVAGSSYVGLPLAVELAEAAGDVLGVDRYEPQLRAVALGGSYGADVVGASYLDGRRRFEAEARA